MGWHKGPVNHPLELWFLFVIKAIPIGLVGVGHEELAGAILVSTVLNMLAHANLDLAPGPLDWIFTVNHHHFRHHALDIATSRSNYGCAIIVWDRLFGTFHDDDLPDRPMGIDDGRPLGLGAQLRLPFR
jgi:ornithine lipid hydroxylase